MTQDRSEENNQTSSDAQTSEVGEHSKRLTERRRFMQGAGVAGAVIATGMAAQAVGRTKNENQGPALGGPPCESSASTSSSSEIDHTDLAARYQRAWLLKKGSYNKQIAFNTTLYPHWIGDTDHFWYQRDTSPDTHEYRLVDAVTRDNQLAFDHSALARALGKVAKEKVEADKLPLTDIDIQIRPRKVSFKAFDKNWQYDADRQDCVEQEVYPGDWAISPNGKHAVFVRDYNLWFSDLENGRERALTEDGGPFYRYASTPSIYGRQERFLLQAQWSPDSKRIFTTVIDTREVKVGPPLVEHVPSDGSLRPRIVDPDRRVAWYGEEHVEGDRMLAIEVANGRIQWADYPICRMFYPHYKGIFGSHRAWWNADSRRAYFVDLAQHGKTGRLLEFNTRTGEVRELIKETSETGVTLIPESHLCALVIPLIETNELIWYSERSGWAHLYLYDLNTGQLKNSVTHGDWLVRNILHLDVQKRELFIQTAGRVSGRNPYCCDICRVNIDTGELKPILSTDDEYVVMDQRSRISGLHMTAKGVSATGNYLVTTRSRVDRTPVSLVVDRDGKILSTVETANISGLPKGWQWPEPVMLKAADGRSDIYGVVFRPSNFSADKSYPVVDYSFRAYNPVGSFTNNHTGNWMYLEPSALAELGFIVVMINKRGGHGVDLGHCVGMRDTAFTSYEEPDPSLPQGLHRADCVAGIKQLAKRYPYMDLNRVGIGSMYEALNGLLVHPDFYKVGACLMPIDTRMVGTMADRLIRPTELEDLAANLRGKALLMHGMMDNVATVAWTFRLVEALQKANKRFDMLILPNQGHAHTDYSLRRAWEYLITHLQGIELPTDIDTREDA